MNPVYLAFGSGYWSRILLTPYPPPADAVPLPLPTGLPFASPLVLPVHFPVAVPLMFPSDGSCPIRGGMEDSSSNHHWHPYWCGVISLPATYSIHMATEALTNILRKQRLTPYPSATERWPASLNPLQSFIPFINSSPLSTHRLAICVNSTQQINSDLHTIIGRSLFRLNPVILGPSSC